MRVITVTHLKGGAAKTTTAGYLAHALDNMGYKVLAIDSDPQGSLLRWSRRTGWKIPVRHMANRGLDVQMKDLYTEGYDFAVIDTAPYDLGTVSAAMRAADIILVPLPPNFEDVAQVKVTYGVIEGMLHGADVRIVLTRVDARTVASPRDAREAMVAAGRTVLETEISQLQMLAQATASIPSSERGYGGYTGVALELLR